MEDQWRKAIEVKEVVTERQKEITRGFAMSLSREIVSRSTYDVDEIAAAINNRLEDWMDLLALTKSAKSEQAAERLKMEAMKAQKVSKQRYLEVSYLLSAANKKVATIRKLIDDIRKRHQFHLVGKIIKERYGNDVWQEISEAAHDQFYKNIEDKLDLLKQENVEI